MVLERPPLLHPLKSLFNRLLKGHPAWSLGGAGTELSPPLQALRGGQRGQSSNPRPRGVS